MDAVGRLPRLYETGPQLNTECVFGRLGLLAGLKRLLDQGQSVTLFGIRRIGASTVLRTLSVDGSLPGRGCHYFDLHGYRRHDELLHAVARQLLSAGPLTRSHRRARSSPVQDGLTFGDLKRLLMDRKDSGVALPILLFDHFDRQVGALLDESAVNSWRDLINDKLLLLVTTYSGRPLLRKETHYFNNSAKRRIGFLDSAAVEKMLTKPLEDANVPRFDDRDRAWVKRAGGVHPHFLAAACRCVLQLRDIGASEQDYNEMFILDAGGQYNRYLDELSAKQIAALAGLAAHGSAAGSVDADVEALCVRNGDRLSLFSDSFADFACAAAHDRVGTPCGRGGVVAEVSPPLVFYSYSHKDSRFKDKLDRHLTALRDSSIATWHDRMLHAGEDFNESIQAKLEAAQIILLLVSDNFMSSNYIRGIEMRRAMERHAAREAIVVPVILSDVDYRGTPIAPLTPLPTDGKAVTSRHWKNQNEAFKNVAEGLRQLLASRTPQS